MEYNTFEMINRNFGGFSAGENAFLGAIYSTERASVKEMIRLEDAGVFSLSAVVCLCALTASEWERASE